MMSYKYSPPRYQKNRLPKANFLDVDNVGIFQRWLGVYFAFFNLSLDRLMTDLMVEVNFMTLQWFINQVKIQKR